MAAFEITHSARNGSNTSGSVWVERTGKVYGFLAFPNGNVMLARGDHPVPINHLRDVRYFVSKRFAPAPAAPAMAPQQCQQQQADAGRRGFIRSALTAGLLAASAAPVVASKDGHSVPTLRGDDTPRLPDHAALWSRMPLPFTPAQAWHLLSPTTQAEIGAAVIGMELAQYVYGDGRADADQFTDEGLRSEASDVADDLLNRIDDRLWVLLPDLYGPEGDHPRWAYDASMVYPLGTVLPEEEPEPVLPAADPIFAAIEKADAARRAHQAMHEGLDEDDDAQMARLDALVDADRAAFTALASVIPTTRAGDVALADFYLRALDDPDGQATAHLAHLRAVLAGSTAT